MTDLDPPLALVANATARALNGDYATAIMMLANAIALLLEAEHTHDYLSYKDDPGTIKHQTSGPQYE